MRENDDPTSDARGRAAQPKGLTPPQGDTPAGASGESVDHSQRLRKFVHDLRNCVFSLKCAESMLEPAQPGDERGKGARDIISRSSTALGELINEASQIVRDFERDGAS